MTQYGFFVDQSRCIGCHACSVSCMQWHDIQPGTVKWMRVYQWESGTFPEARLHILPIMCYHCENPVCIKACPNSAIYKEDKYGAVLVDFDKCRGTKKCWQACPYGTPQFHRNDNEEKMSKCNMCIDRLEKGLKPICVLSCSMRALEFGLLDELTEKYGNLRRLEYLPTNRITRPAVIFKPAAPKKQAVPWNVNKALELWREREPHQGQPLPHIFNTVSEVTNAPTDIVGRNKLVLKAKNSQEFMYYTTDNE